jgi:DtxR family Mn-dependent transcriptional regulator
VDTQRLQQRLESSNINFMLVMTETVQDYLKAIWMLDRAGSVSTSALAERLGVTAASATAMIKRLAGVGLVRHEPYHGVALTEAGTQAALEVIRHHRLLELYLMQALGLSWDEVHAEAERLEHHLSETLEARIDAALGHPTRDPHGDPIPSPELELVDENDRPLSDLARGMESVIRRVPDGDPELLRYLAQLGFMPDERVVMVGHAPFDGPLTVEVAGERHAISRELADRIRIEGSP